ncbi:MAG TPA: methylated-DNA--[protein]-cysteine S-methyltransferase [Dehalococcoidia bacterium]|nr:methylated-DNA--[protein]-cysteine S-methyltransferase [Dehalococcoidia bacterium]
MKRAAVAAKRVAAHYGLTDTAMGPMLVAVAGDRLIAVKFNVDEGRLARAVEDLHRETRGTFELVRSDAKVRPCAKQLREYLAGKRAGFDLRLDVSWVTPFRRAVLEECARIPRGTTATYGDLARRVGRPNAYRAVGHTMSANPIPIVIPCHRVVGASGDLTGFGGGLEMKLRLLALEGVALAV